ncbi:serine/threonine protein phosphatase [Xylophilus rhododendri]|uniref:Serine/threonine protein phosphatase n=1 Tax=Xylophilus rhododendri TaxID=2697032 RepID=A0A857JD51_9BURK|nr:metallophosphoesterase [Xylophilus rhododendri]QHJ00689.1 serine/threonine protein phosphatase [Xylophilus rhododendri]
MSHRLRRRAQIAAGLALAVTAVAIAACGGSNDPITPATTTDAQVQAAWTEIGANNQVIVRAITTAGTCPRIAINGAFSTMALRAPATTVAQRPTASAAADSKPSVFAVTACETLLASSATDVFVGGRAMPLPKAAPQRIAVLADTGCRLKKADNAYQPCLDTNAWPFATIAATIASMKPDLVMHIGDYHYRENACPTDIAGCKDSPWGYGWDTWAADFFTPGAPLLAAAPWVVTRGNHEECARAGQGWSRFLDVRPFSAAMSCDDPANDNGGNVSDPYAVALGSDTQIVLFDSAKVGTAGLPTTDYKFPIYQDQFRKVAAIAADTTKTTLFANHHPILAFAPLAGAAPAPGNTGLQAVMKTLNPVTYYPDGVKIALHGHVHDFQAISFSTNHPATFVTGNGGDNVDVNLPDPLPAGTTPAPGAVLDKITHTNTFGFMMMERSGSQWLYKAYTKTGVLLTTCVPNGSKIACDKTGFLAPS